MLASFPYFPFSIASRHYYSVKVEASYENDSKTFLEVLILIVPLLLVTKGGGMVWKPFTITENKAVIHTTSK